MSSAQVLIVGAGPTGLSCAAFLAKEGISCRIVDKGEHPTSSEISKAVMLHARTLEILEGLGGVSEKLVAQGRKIRGNKTFTEGGEQIVELTFLQHLQTITQYPFALGIQQGKTERILREYLDSKQVKIERPIILKTFSQDDDGVNVVLENLLSHTEEQLRVQYLIGCDGCHSVVRKLLHIDFQGELYDERFSLADVKVDIDQQNEHALLGVHSDFLLALLPLPDERGTNFYRCILDELKTKCIKKEEDNEIVHGETKTDITLEKLQNYISIIFPNAKCYDPTWMTAFRVSHRIVSRYQEKRVFICGDAAHIHSPLGGQGMNTGIQDAANLAWKLALVVQGSSPPTILETYTTERLKVGQQVLLSTDLMTKAATLKKAWQQRLRDTILTGLTKLEFFQRHVVMTMSEINIKYDSSIIRYDSVERSFIKAFRYYPYELLGYRVPDVHLEDGSRLLEKIRGKHALLFFVPSVDDNSLKHDESTFKDNYLSAERIALQVRFRFGRDVGVHLVLPNLQDHLKKLCKWDGSVIFDDQQGQLFQTFRAGFTVFIVRPDLYVGYIQHPFVDSNLIIEYLYTIFL